MSSMLWTVLAFALINYVVKAIGPVLLAGRSFPPRVRAVVEALPAALLAGMLVCAVVGPQGRAFDATLCGGLAATAVAWACRIGPLACVVVGVLAAVALRAAM